MATLYPFSNDTAEFLATPPEPGNTHSWLPQAAGRLRHVLAPDRCFAFLRQCCDAFVTHRPVPDTEIKAAVEFAYSEPLNRSVTRTSLAWPDPHRPTIDRFLAATTPIFDGITETGLQAVDVLPHLFRPGELVCVGPDSSHALVRPLAATLADAHLQQFIVINPMRGQRALKHTGEPSARCQNNTGPRRHLVAEFDDRTVTKLDQAKLITCLAAFVPLVLVVDSGGKSLHAWFRVDHLGHRDQARFFAFACLLGADKTRWDICGWLRMPGGLRREADVPPIRQRILYLNPNPDHDACLPA